MAEYISRHEAIRAVQLSYGNYEATRKAIFEIPAADVAPVRRGRWVLIGADKRGRGGIWECTACRRSYPYKCDYCPNCGAHMKKEDKSDG